MRALTKKAFRYAVNEEYSRLVAFGMSFTGLKEKRTTQFQGSDEVTYQNMILLLML